MSLFLIALTTLDAATVPDADVVELTSGELTLLCVVLGTFSLLGIASALQALMTTRTSQGTIAWVISLLTWAPIAVPAYWIFGRDKFLGYINSRRSSCDTFSAVSQSATPQMTPYSVELTDEQSNARVLEQLASLPFTSGNETKLLIDGEETFAAIFDAIDEAKEYILVEFFIVNDDDLGRELKDRLIQQAKKGVEVYFLYDNVGSAKMTRRYLQDLRDAGANVTGMNTTRGWRNRFQLNFRNHRKIVVVDGKTSFVGGHNVGDEYVGRHRRLTPWRDTHLSIVGPAVIATQLAFLEDWYWATQVIPDLPWKPHPSKTADQTVFVLPSGPADEYETCGLFFTHAINSAKHRIWIASPYFVPDEAVITALQLAALRGVDVRIMIPGLADKPFIKWAAMSYVTEVRKAGIKIYEFGDGFLHQKVMLIDDVASTVGTANLDNRSFRLNFEISILTFDAGFATELETMLNHDFERSTLIDDEMMANRSYLSRLGSRVARLFSPVL
ncbi:MAG: cardiolipin synthase [Rubripirellula sp.]